MDSPLGHLDPSRITHMVVDQVGLGGPGVHPDNDGFVVPGPPYQVGCLEIFYGLQLWYPTSAHVFQPMNDQLISNHVWLC